YVELARQASTTLDTMQRSRQLLVLDLNGTLLSRNKNRKSMYVRPHIDLFLRYIFARFEVMVWSSASRKSVHNMLHLFGKKRRSLLAVWTREDLGLTQEQFDAKVPTCKDLQRLIDAPLLRDHQPHYDLSNIIVLDDSPRKITMQPFNCVAVRTFHHTDPDFGTHGDQELLRVMQYLDRLCLETNVPGFIRTTPYNDKFTLKDST
ncbi:HAD-like domain-containing protein, partial [Gongronella butleri]